jgi:exonuclease SbcC
MLEIEADGTLGHSLESFKSARPGADILDIVSNVAAKAHKNQLEVFRKTVDDASMFENQDPHTILVDIAKAQGLDKDIQNLALRAIIQAEKDSDELNTGLKGFVESPTPISLEWIELENFQAHGKTRFDFDGTGLNAIIGASDSGKTAVVRGLRWLLYNDPKGTEFIRFGESRATVRAHFSNGKTIERSRTQSSAGHYRITDSTGDTQEYTGFNHNVPIDVINAHQMPKTQLSKDVESSLNISYQLDGSFLIGESTSTRASVIGRLTGVHIVDAAIRETGKKVLNIQRDIKADLREEESLVERLATDFTDLPELQDEVNQLELLLAHGQKLEKKLTELQDIGEQYQDVCDTIQKSTQGLVKIIPVIAQTQTLLAQAEAKQLELANLKQIAEAYNDAESSIETAVLRLAKYRGLKRITAELENSQDTARRLSALKVIDDELFSKDAEIRKSEMKLAGLPNISVEEMDSIQESIDRLKSLKRIEDNIDEQVELIEEADSNFEVLDLDITHYSQQYKTVLKEMGKCPTCYTPIDDTIIDRIEL